MKSTKTMYIILALASFMVSCNVAHNIAYPNHIQFESDNITSGNVSISYADTTIFDELKSANKRLYFIPVEVVNNSNAPFKLTAERITVFNNYEPVRVVDFQHYFKKVKRKQAPNYAVGSVGLILSLGISSNGIHPSIKNPLWLLPIGATYFAIRTKQQNTLLKRKLLEHDLLNDEIAPQSQQKGFICIQSETPIKELAIRIER